MSIYLDSGFLDFPWIAAYGLPFNFIVGGRGTGKTYGALDYAVENEKRFMFMRRTQTQMDIIGKPEYSPFKALNVDKGWSISTSPITKNSVGFWEMMTDEKGRNVPVGPLLGYGAALATFSNLRGFDGSDIDIMILDEFIPEKHERPIKNEASAFFNAYETINRNRELKGQQPLQCFCLANANDLGNPIFMELKLIEKAEKMRLKGQEISIDNRRGIGLFILNASPISAMKKDTALYRAAAGSEYEDMALANQFAEMRSRSIKSEPLAEFKPVITVGELTIYKHKSERRYYASTHRSGDCPTFGTSDTELTRLWRAHYWVWEAYMQNNITFENVTCEVLLTKYWK